MKGDNTCHRSLQWPDHWFCLFNLIRQLRTLHDLLPHEDSNIAAMVECTSINRSISAPNPPSQSQKLRWHQPNSQRSHAMSTYALQTEFLLPSPPDSPVPWSDSSETKSRGLGSDKSELDRGQFFSASNTRPNGKADSDTSYQPSEISDSPQQPYEAVRFAAYDHLMGTCPWDETISAFQPSQALDGLIPCLESFKFDQVAEPERHISSPAESAESYFPGYCLDVDVTKQRSKESPFDDNFWGQSQSLKDFQEDPAHKFWTWDIGREQWFHRDDDTGSVIWCPTELD